MADVSVSQNLRRVAMPLAVGTLLFLMSVGSIVFTRGDDFISRIWLANAVLAAVMLHTTPREWPGLAAAGYFGFLGAHLVCGDGLVHSLVLAALKLGEVLIVAFLLNRRFDLRSTLATFSS